MSGRVADLVLSVPPQGQAVRRQGDQQAQGKTPCTRGRRRPTPERL